MIHRQYYSRVYHSATRLLSKETICPKLVTDYVGIDGHDYFYTISINAQ